MDHTHSSPRPSNASSPEAYTCPMHPKVEAKGPGTCPQCGMTLIPKENNAHAGQAVSHGRSHHMQKHDTHRGPTHSHGDMMATPQAMQQFLNRFIFVSILLVPSFMVSMPGMKLLGLPDFAFRPWLELGFATAIFTLGFVFFEHAYHEIRSKQLGMMTLVSIAVGAGYLFSAAATFFPALEVEFYLEISTLIWVLLFGHYLEARSSSAAGDALQEVAKLLPKEAHVSINGTIKEVPIAELKAGDIVVVRPGEKVPADGEIIKGSSHFNEAHISGESKPVQKKVGDQAIAGAIAEESSVEITLDKVGENSTIGQIQKLIGAAQHTKPSAQRLADRAASILTITALVVAVSTILVWSLLMGEPLVFSLTLAITVLVIACPHALGLAIPTVSTIATKKAVENGIFIKDMSKLEIIRKATYVVMDKTGTLTEGIFGVTDIIALEQNDTAEAQQKVLAVAAGLEVHSSHVIGLSIVEAAKAKQHELKPVSEFKNIAGKGLEAVMGTTRYIVGNSTLMKERGVLNDKAQAAYRELVGEGKTVVFLADQEKVLGLIGLADKVKADALEAVTGLHELGVKVAMLTGDNEGVAKSVARQLGIDTFYAQVLPEKKYSYVKELQEKGHVVLMVGDGVNDAPALTQADAGVAIGAGTDVAVEAGDVVLTRSNPGDIVSLIVLSRKVYTKMVQNLWWALGYNIVAIPAAAGLFIPLGFFLRPQIGALVMAMSSVIVVINAMTLRRARISPLVNKLTKETSSGFVR